MPIASRSTAQIASRLVPWVILALILLATAAMLISQTLHLEATSRSVQATAGQLDLGNWPGRDVVILGGQWQYYPNLRINDIANMAGTRTSEYRTVPDHWLRQPGPGGGVTGVATYRLRVSGLNPDTHYAVNILDQASAYRLLINGRLIIENGTVADRQADYVPAWHSQTGYFHADANGQALFLLEVANFDYMDGGFWKAIRLGTESVLNAHVTAQKNLEIFLLTFSLVLGLFFLSTFTVNRDFIASLHLSIACFLLVVRVIVRGHRQIYDYLPTMPWDLAVRIEFMVGYLLLPVLVLMFFHLQFTPRYAAIKWSARGLILAIVFLTLFTPNTVYGRLYPYFVNLVVLSLVYFSYILIQGLRQHRKGAVLMLLSYAVVIPAVLHELYTEPDFSLIPYAFLYMLILFSYLTMMNFFDAYRQKNQLEMSINIDPLTGLKNRFCLNAILDKGISVPPGQALYILFMDLDKFKAINDQYGHGVGDGVLIEASRRIQACFHERDLVCRYGGDEFVIFTWLNRQTGDISQTVNQVVGQFCEPIVIDARAYEAGISIGVSRYEPGEDLESIIRQSDHAMYTAKKTSGHSVFYREGSGSPKPEFVTPGEPV